MDIAVIGTSRKENENRRPIHPSHIANIPKQVREHLIFERGYGMPFGMSDDEIRFLTGNDLMDRKQLLRNLKAVLITKPVIEDFEEVGNGTMVWGWLHSVQQRYIAQLGIDKKLTLIAWENMYYESGRELIHTFSRNNELAGYCGVQHALEVVGLDGNFGPVRDAAIISFGSVSRGAIFSLRSHGINNITVYTQRPTSLVANQIPGITYHQFAENEFGGFDIIHLNGSRTPIIDELTSVDIIVNGILQNPVKPIILVNDDDIIRFQTSCLVIDVSCSKGMGFSFAYPTTFSNPIANIGNIQYYGVDHTPTLLWNSATWEISQVLLPYLESVVLEKENKVITDAIDIKNGKIMNQDILMYQNRSKVYPYKQLSDEKVSQ
ncbi:MAG: alanine dehydrogenase [Firmicutes bacterium HGW-Firmicutes-2]|jgi:alanine dehydrogenase|nr:MAG: alanine dehydrogenase [Firmicutes bacterium HGW-Firmicutes-2]